MSLNEKKTDWIFLNKIKFELSKKEDVFKQFYFYEDTPKPKSLLRKKKLRKKTKLRNKRIDKEINSLSEEK